MPDQTKDANINLRINKDQIELLKQKAELNGIGYQTLLTIIIHQYLNDKIFVKL